MPMNDVVVVFANGVYLLIAKYRRSSLVKIFVNTLLIAFDS